MSKLRDKKKQRKLTTRKKIQKIKRFVHYMSNSNVHGAILHDSKREKT